MTIIYKIIDQTRHRMLYIIMKDQYTGSIYGGLGHLLFKFCQLNEIAIPDELLAVQDLERFAYSDWYKILSLLDEQLHRPALGLEIARHIETRHIGVLGYLAQSCHNLGEAFQQYYDFYRLIYDGAPLIVHIQNSQLMIGWDVPKIFTTQITDEIALAILYQFLLQFISKQNLVIHSVMFRHEQPCNVAYYEKYFSAKVTFSQSTSCLVIPLQTLMQPIYKADETLQHLLLHQAKDQLAVLPECTALDARIQQTILFALQQQQINIDYVSQKLGLSIRQLQRHLKKQKTTFQQRIQQIRLGSAKQYLADPHLSLHEIALMLGYSEQSAFQRAFKQWTDQTPQNWRKIHQK